MTGIVSVKEFKNIVWYHSSPPQIELQDFGVLLGSVFHHTRDLPQYLASNLDKMTVVVCSSDKVTSFVLALKQGKYNTLYPKCIVFCQNPYYAKQNNEKNKDYIEAYLTDIWDVCEVVRGLGERVSLLRNSQMGNKKNSSVKK